MISFGTKVAVLPGTSYGGLFAGHTGTVCKWHRATNKIGVNLDGVRNPESKEGIFWFPENQLGIIQPNRDMDGGHMVDESESEYRRGGNFECEESHL